MSYLLIITFCTLFDNVCLPPLESKKIYQDYYSCMQGGYLDSLAIYSNLGRDDVNKDLVTIGFECIGTRDKAV
tara:strand:+ start:632 stop:850 length:219 start_codon:yes stop_codon:yes gene_type:complete